GLTVLAGEGRGGARSSWTRTDGVSRFFPGRTTLGLGAQALPSLGPFWPFHQRGSSVFGLGKPKAVVGLDIGSSAVKAIELRPSGKAYKVAAFGTQPVPSDAIVDGAIIDAGAVADAIRRVFDGNKAFKTKDVCASLSGNAVIVKKITLPVMTENELAESIYWE